MRRILTKLRAGEHVTIVALGDSITEGTFHTRGRMNWVGLLAEALFEQYGPGICTMINRGICGGNAQEARQRLQRDVLRFQPDLLIVALGMNDACRGLDGLPAFREAMRAIITESRAACGCEVLLRTPNPVVTVHGLPLPPEQPRPGRPWESSQRPLAAYAAATVELAEALKCACVDHYTSWCKREVSVPQPVADPTGLWPRMGDAIHPGWLGHLAFFRELAPHFGVARYFPWEEMSE